MKYAIGAFIWWIAAFWVCSYINHIFLHENSWYVLALVSTEVVLGFFPGAYLMEKAV